jgi:tRNA A-37 threonylcarbamoyl transferase component Bud32
MAENKEDPTSLKSAKDYFNETKITPELLEKIITSGISRIDSNPNYKDFSINSDGNVVFQGKEDWAESSGKADLLRKFLAFLIYYIHTLTPELENELIKLSRYIGSLEKDTIKMYNKAISQTSVLYLQFKSLPVAYSIGAISKCTMNPIIFESSWTETFENYVRKRPYIYEELEEKKLDSNDIKEDYKTRSYIADKMLSNFIKEFLLRVKTNMGNKVLERYEDFGDNFKNVVYFRTKKVGNPCYWEIFDIVGSGDFGVVRRACCNKDCSHVIKIMLPTKYTNKSLFIKNFKREMEIWKIASSIRIAPNLDSVFLNNDGDYGLAVSEILYTTLHDFLTKVGHTITYNDAIDLFKMIVSLLRTLHNDSIIHGDVHLGNIMLKTHGYLNTNNPAVVIRSLQSRESELRFIDFGFSFTEDMIEENPDEVMEFFEENVPDRIENSKCNFGSEDLFNVLKCYDFERLRSSVKSFNRIYEYVRDTLR